MKGQLDMRELGFWVRRLLPLAICFSFSPTLAAAEGSPRVASGSVARTARPGCAKLVCQRRAFVADQAPGKGQARVAKETPVSVRFGLGVSAFRGPPPVEQDLPVEFFPREGSPYSGVETSVTRRAKIQGAVCSLGVSLQQTLSAPGALRWGLEERLSLLALMPLDGGSSVAGVSDVLIFARDLGLPVRIALGPSLTIARLDLADESLNLDEPAVIAAGAAVIGLDTDALPVALELIGHLGKPLSYDGGSYRDLLLTLAVPL